MKNAIIAGIVVIFILIVILLLVYMKADFNASVIDEGNVREIVIDAKRFEYSPNVIKIKEGERIRIKVNNLDTEHGMSIPELGFESHDEVGAEFVFDKKGTFDFYCHHYCGEGHSQMKGVIIVE